MLCCPQIDTHLRTASSGPLALVVQVLLAIAAGAVLVTPEWLTASVEAGEWLPEEPFLPQVCCLSCARPSLVHASMYACINKIVVASQHQVLAVTPLWPECES